MSIHALDLDLIGAPAFTVLPITGGFRYTGLNARLEILTGLDRRLLVGSTPFECPASDIALRVSARFARCMEVGEALEYEEYYDLPAGGMWWAITLTPVIDPVSQSVTGLLGIATDITSRRHAELAHEEAVARLSLAMEVIDGGFWHLDVPAPQG